MTAGAACPVCDAPLGEERKRELLYKRRNELKALAKEVEEAEVLSSKLGEQVRRTQELHRKALMLEKDAEGLTKLDTELEDIRRQLTGLEADIPKQRRLVEELAGEVAKSRKEADELSEKLSSARQWLQNRIDLEARSVELNSKLGDLQCAQAKIFK